MLGFQAPEKKFIWTEAQGLPSTCADPGVRVLGVLVATALHWCWGHGKLPLPGEAKGHCYHSSVQQTSSVCLHSLVSYHSNLLSTYDHLC